MPLWGLTRQLAAWADGRDQGGTERDTRRFAGPGENVTRGFRGSGRWPELAAFTVCRGCPSPQRCPSDGFPEADSPHPQARTLKCQLFISAEGSFFPVTETLPFLSGAQKLHMLT